MAGVVPTPVGSGVANESEGQDDLGHSSGGAGRICGGGRGPRSVNGRLDSSRPWLGLPLDFGGRSRRTSITGVAMVRLQDLGQTGLVAIIPWSIHSRSGDPTPSISSPNEGTPTMPPSRGIATPWPPRGKDRRLHSQRGLGPPSFFDNSNFSSPSATQSSAPSRFAPREFFPRIPYDSRWRHGDSRLNGPITGRISWRRVFPTIPRISKSDRGSPTVIAPIGT